MVHNLAMGQLEMQKSLSRIEDGGFDKAHADITAADPVFITSLPRADTTLLLELVAGALDSPPTLTATCPSCSTR